MKNFYYFVFVIVMSACSVTTEESTTSTGSSDGTAAAPVELTVGTAKNGTVSSSGYSYYKFTTSSGAGNYKLNIASLVNADSYYSSYSVHTQLYLNSGYTSSSWIDSEYCLSDCILYFDYVNLDNSTYYYLQISGYGAVSYSLTVSKGGSEGSRNNPVELKLSTAHASGTIDNIWSYPNYGASYYKFTTSSADNYTLSMNNSDSLECILYSNSTFSTEVHSSYNNCTASINLSKSFTGTTSSVGLLADTEYYLKIWGSETTAKTTTYDNMTVAPEG